MPILHQMHLSGNCYAFRLDAHQLCVTPAWKDDPLTWSTYLQSTDDWELRECCPWMFFGQCSHEPSIAVARYNLSHAPAAVTLAEFALYAAAHCVREGAFELSWFPAVSA